MDRRHFLKAVGVAIPLPLLRSLSFAGQAPGKEPGKPVKRFVSVSNNYGIYAKAFFPDQAGKDYVLPSTLQPMERHRKEFTVFSNLDHGIAGGHACVPTLLNGIMPYLAIVIGIMILMYLFPGIALWLPDVLFGKYIP